jgi:integrase
LLTIRSKSSLQALLCLQALKEHRNNKFRSFLLPTLLILALPLILFPRLAYAAQEIIEGHEKLPKRGNKLLYLYTNQKINLHLKVIAKECGIAKKITCKVARHNFATASLNNGLTLEQTGLMLGHTHTQTTAIYGKMNINGIKSLRKNLETIYA